MSPLCNKDEGGLLQVLNVVYVAAFWLWFDLWKRFNRSIKDSSSTFKQVEVALGRPARLLGDFQKAAGLQSRIVDQDLEFTDLAAKEALDGATNQHSPVSKRLQSYAVE